MSHSFIQNCCWTTWNKELRYLGILLFLRGYLDVRWTTPSARSIEQRMQFSIKLDW